jgi:serine/threonine-protein kinase RsbW
MSDKVLHMVVAAELQALSRLETAVDQALTGIQELSDDLATRYNLVLALHELCTNVIRHAYAGEAGQITVDIRLGCCTREVTIQVRDQGRHAFDPACWAGRDLSEPSEGGMGLWLIRQLVDHITYRRSATGNEWVLTMRMGRAPATVTPGTSHA